MNKRIPEADTPAGWRNLNKRYSWIKGSDVGITWPSNLFLVTYCVDSSAVIQLAITSLYTGDTDYGSIRVRLGYVGGEFLGWSL